MDGWRISDLLEWSADYADHPDFQQKVLQWLVDLGYTETIEDGLSSSIYRVYITAAGDGQVCVERYQRDPETRQYMVYEETDEFVLITDFVCLTKAPPLKPL